MATFNPNPGSVSWQLRLARDPIPTRTALTPEQFAHISAEAATTVLCTATLIDGMTDDAIVQLARRLLKRADRDWVLDGKPRPDAQVLATHILGLGLTK